MLCRKLTLSYEGIPGYLYFIVRGGGYKGAVGSSEHNGATRYDTG